MKQAINRFSRLSMAITFIVTMASLAPSINADDKTQTSSDAVKYKGIFGSSLSIDGTSTVHDWTVTTRLISGVIEFDSNFPLDPSVEKIGDFEVQPKVEITIPVRSIKSGKTRMDEVMHATMKRDEHPDATYKLLKLTPSGKARKSGDPLKFDSTGILSVAGATKLVKFPVIFKNEDGDKLKISGKTTVKMTDFGMDPPAPKVALGLIKTGDEVEIKFDWMTKKQD